MSGARASVRLRALVVLVLLVACRSDSGPRAAEASASGSDSSTTVIDGPTLLSSFPITQAQIDSGGDANEAYADYQHYLSLAMPVLERFDVQVVATNDSILRWRDSLGAHALTLADSVGIAYLFVAPNGKLLRLGSGVQADGAILDAARSHFALPIPMPARDSVEP
jgi:hypothetical protein